MFFKEGRFHPICKELFADNEVGVELFCKKLGYQAGLITETSLSLLEPAIQVGKCLSNDSDLANCTGGGNSKQTGGCANGIKVVCYGGKGKVHTCGGKC